MADGEQKKASHRSRSYPSVDLKTAIEKARTLYQKDKRSPVAKEVAISHWGYSPTGSPGVRLLAALGHYGLIDEIGTGSDRKVRLSDLAYHIIIDERPDSKDREALIRKAALEPTLFREIWTEHDGKIPSDENLRYELVKNEVINSNTVLDFISTFRATIEFAGLSESNTLSEEGGDKPIDRDDPPMNPPPSHGGVSREKKGMPTTTMDGRTDFDIQIPLFEGGQITVRVPLPLTEEEYEYAGDFLAISWQKMRKALTRQRTATDSGEEG